jgi:hypothetical protein
VPAEGPGTGGLRERAGRVALVAEDRRFVDFLQPAIHALARELGRFVKVDPVVKLHGCRPRQLHRECERIHADCDVLVVAADAAGGTRARSASSHRRKAQLLRPLVEPWSGKLVLALAAPSVEAWLWSDQAAFSAGLSAGLGEKFRAPSRWARAASEPEAKSELGRLIREGTGQALARAGFEFAPEIVGRMRLVDSPSPSLAEWARDMRAHLSR